MSVVTANDMKTKGISAIEQLLQDAQEVVISLRGEPRYDFLRECEIAAAWAQTRDDLAAGRYRRETAGAHIWIDCDSQRSPGVISMSV